MVREIGGREDKTETGLDCGRVGGERKERLKKRKKDEEVEQEKGGGDSSIPPLLLARLDGAGPTIYQRGGKGRDYSGEEGAACKQITHTLMSTDRLSVPTVTHCAMGPGGTCTRDIVSWDQGKWV